MSTIAILLANDFEDSEYTVPRQRLEEAGHEVEVLGVASGTELRGKRGDAVARVDAPIGAKDPSEFDAVVIPGGYSPDQLRIDKDAVEFVRGFAETGRPIAAVCHGPQLMIEAGVVEGRTMTSWPSVRTDLENAGVDWVDEQVVEDGAFITSRKPDDLQAFSAALVERLAD